MDACISSYQVGTGHAYLHATQIVSLRVPALRPRRREKLGCMGALEQLEAQRSNLDGWVACRIGMFRSYYCPQYWYGCWYGHASRPCKQMAECVSDSLQCGLRTFSIGALQVFPSLLLNDCARLLYTPPCSKQCIDFMLDWRPILELS